MKIKLHVNYKTNWGQTLFVCGSVPPLGNNDESNALEMVYTPESSWSVEFECNEEGTVEYYYIVKEGNRIIHKEWGGHRFSVEKGKCYEVEDTWRNMPQQQFLYTSGFTDSFFKHEPPAKAKFGKKSLVLLVECPYVKKDQSLILVGATKTLGEWKLEKALHFTPQPNSFWQLVINAANIKQPQEYKLAIYDHRKKDIIHWEEGPNRMLQPLPAGFPDNSVHIESFSYWHGWMNWKSAGVAIPVFSLRSEDSFGIGEFSDLKKMVDWAAATSQNIIQILPINDTTNTHTWIDSYPYNAISIYALHPIYLGLKEFPLENAELYKEYLAKAKELNKLSQIDYEKVYALKQSYLIDLFEESGSNVLKSKEYKDFYSQNEEWLFPYACFSYLRDKYKTPDFKRWSTFSKYNKKALQKSVDGNKDFKTAIELLFFTQFLLHKQLLGVRQYANAHGVILKGDIPIGISRNSVEAWTEPHLFNMDVQTGAPPDDFSFYGQNWGFPTYNWDEMAKDGYQWWVKRFRKMADYFDAYRIDHILGFFRIWEIPLSSVQGLLGYFSPALPLTVGEINSSGMYFSEERMASPFIHENYLGEVFGEYAEEVKQKYLHTTGWQLFGLNEECNTQVKIKSLFAGQEDVKNSHIRDGLYSLCNEVLFIKDKREPDKYHPRITAQFSYSYKFLSEGEKYAFNRLYDDFFYRRHTQFWHDQAMKKLPTLISSTSMLVCGEDLGMVPDSVPWVMNKLQILSLEIERMPKERNVLFNSLPSLPYLSVCTTSTHDMSPIRAWWHENKELTQTYYNQVLWKQGPAPDDCSSDLCWQIVSNHLNSPSMLAILPLQDWLSISDSLKYPNPEAERINIPAIAQHYWRYRMHITLEELLAADDFNQEIRTMIKVAGRE
ncbi:4-alpha-glucanotransferase [Dysgonomonas sp. 511]|uniref:4-alpha-glucanotransferase n=1 Tax=Dysgonomonas sp. 511 TaxID=2302930 RepID=UPI0013D4F4DB|nr:4-alpha-glucanotransferase [Dysgonomonas sp. 511]NDV77409.1 hypothetical protein [Dysgonomonas sp. 511]